MNKIKSILWIVWMLVFLPAFMVAYALDQDATREVLKGWVKGMDEVRER